MEFHMRFSHYLVIAALAMCQTARAETAQEAAGGYESVRIRVSICRSTYRLAAYKVETGNMSAADAYTAYLDCKQKLVDEAKGQYKAVAAKIKSSGARAALKNFQASLMTFIEGNEPKDNETTGQFNQRVLDLNEKVESAWQKLALEL